MLQEIQIASKFLSSFVPSQKRTECEKLLGQLLSDQFNGKWYPQQPERASAYRCITNFNKADKLLVFVANSLETQFFDFPSDIVLWIDPGNVSYQQGNNYIVPLMNPQPSKSYTFTERVSVTLKAPNSPQLSPPKSD